MSTLLSLAGPSPGRALLSLAGPSPARVSLAGRRPPVLCFACWAVACLCSAIACRAVARPCFARQAYPPVFPSHLPLRQQGFSG